MTEAAHRGPLVTAEQWSFPTVSQPESKFKIMCAAGKRGASPVPDAGTGPAVWCSSTRSTKHVTADRKTDCSRGVFSREGMAPEQEEGPMVAPDGAKRISLPASKPGSNRFIAFGGPYVLELGCNQDIHICLRLSGPTPHRPHLVDSLYR